MSLAFPLSAIVGQDALVEALLVNAVAPDVGGVLVRGERGSAKSTAVRGLTPLLPPVIAAAEQPFAFAPGELAPGGRIPADAPTAPRPVALVELPLGATLDRLVGSLDLGRALAGEQAFEPGLLARAHQGILYVDEVNLLPDHLVDALLDAAASGVARVEREAISASHAARFILVGTMNVEEGELRPQLLDRFGLGVEVSASKDPGTRSEIVRRRMAFDQDPSGFCARWREKEESLARRIAAARERLPRVALPERELLRITSACAKLGIDGIRGDIVCARAARALAALDAADAVDESHVRRAARLALAHRLRRDPLDGHSGAVENELERALGDRDPDDGPPSRPSGAPRTPTPDSSADGPAGAAGPSGNGGAAVEQPDPRAPARDRRDAPAGAAVPLQALVLTGTGSGPAGRRARAGGPSAGMIDSRPAPPGSDDLAIVATLREQLAHGRAGSLHEHVRSGREGVLLCLVVDASGSMGARRRLARVKGALLALLRDAYARRDRVAIIAFRDGGAQIIVEPGAPVERAAAAIRELAAGGRTPLASGLLAAERLIRREHARDPARRAIAVVLTDGRVPDDRGEVRRASLLLGRAASAVHVIDSEDGPVRLGLAGALAAAAGGRVHTLVAPRATSRRAA
ncbi:von Willebrand factor type A domain-containing protein [Gaiella occulta]|uniref:Mg-protoporphyrin IX chelatase n=1 Tax=Gaiella occulta TaxID=1002870 RepID=A0A7M2YU28_9ACTN|nr:VWA domain-containing protein [Gaiella occulta]RDI73593.1 von Willebrand factor type A domain-containing protein [Gaiella occulta]